MTCPNCGSTKVTKFNIIPIILLGLGSFSFSLWFLFFLPISLGFFIFAIFCFSFAITTRKDLYCHDCKLRIKVKAPNQ